VRRSEALKAILKALEPWQGSQFDKNTANEILAALEALYIIAPTYRNPVTKTWNLGWESEAKNGAPNARNKK
jgi:hypothetical protein